MSSTVHQGTLLSRSGPAIAVIALHIGVLYVLSITMGIVETPQVLKPVEAIFIPETTPAEPEIPEVKPDIAEMQPTDQPVPEINLDEVLAPPSENPMPASDNAIAATAASGAPAQDLKTSQRVEPSYPPTSRRLGEEGTVKLRILVDPSGRSKQVEVATSSGFPRLDQAAMEAVKRWRFVAATNGSSAIEAWTQVSVTFKLTQDRQAAR
jgi:periplasmic protein TonB